MTKTLSSMGKPAVSSWIADNLQSTYIEVDEEYTLPRDSYNNTALKKRRFCLPHRSGIRKPRRSSRLNRSVVQAYSCPGFSPKPSSLIELDTSSYRHTHGKIIRRLGALERGVSANELCDHRSLIDGLV